MKFKKIRNINFCGDFYSFVENCLFVFISAFALIHISFDWAKKGFFSKNKREYASALKVVTEICSG